MCRVVISGYYGYDNAGDEAILQSMVSELRREYSDINIVVLSAQPSETAQRYNVTAINRKNLLDIYSALKNCDMLISGGGSLFQDATSVLSPWYYSGVIMIALMLRKPIYAYAQGIGPVNNALNRRLLKYVMNRVYKISVRDRRSQHELKNLGIKKEVSCTVDPAFLIESESEEKSLSILQNENKGQNLSRPRIGFSIRAWKGGVDVASIFAKVADRVYHELGADVVLFPLYYKDDIVVAQEIADKMESKAIIIRGNYSPEELIGLYGLMDINVCIRFHGLVFSAMKGIPMVAISYDPKIDSFMDYIGINNVIKYNELSSEAVYNAIKTKWVNKSDISTHVSKKMEEFRGLARQGMKEVTQLIKQINTEKR
ncbi:MAG: polysaccharide pyruvyl transferase CsaB [Clostridia bacterium]|nr:polysaccharide pyruvyl transferase CsaB [Clostridia bacterium]